VGREFLDAVKKFFESEEYSSFDTGNSNQKKSIILLEINYEEYNTLIDMGVFETLFTMTKQIA
jgi:hypothetical protein